MTSYGPLRKKSSGSADDFEPHYGTVLGELFHQLAPLPPTGKPGRPRNPKRVIDEDLDYATVHKTRQGSQIIKVECKVIHGTEQQVFARLAESPSQTINTAYIERSNLDWRLWDAHLTRKAPAVARSMRWLRAKFAICVACYNLIRPHETLSRGEDRIFRPKTPAMAANIADHRWTFSEFRWLIQHYVNAMGTSPVHLKTS